MTRPVVNRVLLAVLGIVLAVAGGLALLSAAGPRLAIDGIAVDVPSTWRLLDLSEVVATVDRAVSDLPPEVVRVGVALAGLVLVLLGVVLVVAELRPGRRTRRRRADLDLAAAGPGGGVVAGRAVSGAVAEDLARAPEIASASVATWDDDGNLHLLADIILHAGVRADDVRAAIDGALDRAETALQRPLANARVRMDVTDAEVTRVR